MLDAAQGIVVGHGDDVAVRWVVIWTVGVENVDAILKVANDRNLPVQRIVQIVGAEARRVVCVRYTTVGIVNRRGGDILIWGGRAHVAGIARVRADGILD